MNTNPRENAFDFLRLVAAVTVTIGHAVRHFETKFLWYGDSGPFWFTDGVALFFILSGFLVYKSCDSAIRNKKPMIQYFKNRFLRVVPALYLYLILTVISFFVFGVISISSIDGGFIAWIVSTLALIPVYFPSSLRHFGVGVTNGSLWTIPVEISFYIILPLFVILKNKIGFKKMIVALLSISFFGIVVAKLFGSLYSVEPIWLKLYNVTFLPHLIFFVTGVLFSKLWIKLPQKGYLAIISLISYFVIKNSAILNQGLLGSLNNILIAFPLAYCIFWFGYYAPKSLYRFTSKIGDISYGMYIWHMIVINYFLYFGTNDLITGNTLILITVAISSLLGFLSWHLVEKPFLKLKPYNSSAKQG